MAKGVPSIIAFLVIPLLTNWLTPEQYGVYVWIMSTIGLINVVFFQWIRLSLLRFYQAKPTKDRVLFLAGVSHLFLYVSGFLVLTTGLFYTVFDSKYSTYVFIGVFVLLTQAWFELELELHRSSINPKAYGTLNLTKTLVWLVLSLVFVKLLALGVFGVLVSFVIAQAFSCFLFGKVWKCVFVANKITKIDKTELVKYGVPLTANFAFGYLVGALDKYFIGGYLGNSALGEYSAGYDLAFNVLNSILMIVNLATYPLIVKLVEEKKCANDKLNENLFFLVAIGGGISAIMVLMASEIVPLLVGKDFVTGATAIFPFAAIAMFINGVRAYHFDYSFQLSKRTGIQIYVMVGAVAFSFFANYFLIPILGILGAGLSCVGGYLVSLILSIAIGRKGFRVPLVNKRLLTVAVSILLIVWVFKYLPIFTSYLGVFIKAGFLFATYASLVFMLNAVRVNRDLK